MDKLALSGKTRRVFMQALCRLVRTLPPWESIDAEIRALHEVRVAWMERNPVSDCAGYWLKKMAARNELRNEERRGALDALFKRPWAVHALSRGVQELAEVQQMVRDGWVNKLGENTAYQELQDFCEKPGNG